MNPCSTPSVSVVIPIFNRAAVIQRALGSVIAQTYSDYEIIVVDDGSVDETIAVVEGAGIAALKLIRHPHNRGAAAARNTGIRAARGRWVAFLDSDDVWMPEKLARQIAILSTAETGAVACTSGYFLRRGNRTLRVEIDLTPGQFRTDILYGCRISPGTTLMVDRCVFDDIGLFDESFLRLEDWDWLLRFATGYDIKCNREPLAEVHVPAWRAAHSTGQLKLVSDAIDRIASKHLPQMTSNAQRRQLYSSLLIERAGLAYRNGRFVGAVANVITSLFIYPKRNRAFFHMLWQSFLSLWMR